MHLPVRRARTQLSLQHTGMWVLAQGALKGEACLVLHVAKCRSHVPDVSVASGELKDPGTLPLRTSPGGPVGTRSQGVRQKAGSLQGQ